MISLETIRSRAGILVAIFIGFALFAFIATDLLSSGQSIWQGSQNKVAIIDGVEVEISEFQSKVSILEDFTKLNQNNRSLGEEEMIRLREQTWQKLIQEKLMTPRYNELGLTVTAEELADMTYGKEINPSIRQMFTNPETQQFEKDKVIQFLKNRENDQRASFYWMVLEEELISEKVYNKYKSLISNGLYVTKSQADSEAKAKGVSVDFDYIVKPYTSIQDITIKVSSSEVADYYSTHKQDFKQTPNRNIQFVSFAITPSAEDKKQAMDQIERIKQEFVANSGNAIQFAKLNSDGDVDDSNLNINQVPQSLRTFVTTQSVGSVFGPYNEGEALRVTKIAEIKMVPDSVKARHILISASDPRASEKADSLIGVIKRGASFDLIARLNSTDKGSAANGGDLGWFKEGVMVKQFNNACFSNPKGSIVKVQTQFGTHIIEVLDLGKPVQKYVLATIEKKVNYSSRTYQDIYSKASKFAIENSSLDQFNATAKKENLLVTPVTSINANSTTVSNLESPRELVRWVFDSKNEVGSISPVQEFGNKFVIAAITSISDEDYKSEDEAKDDIIRILTKDKKAEQLVAELSKAAKSASTLSAIVQQENTKPVQTANSITFGSYQVPGAGAEPALVAAATSTPAGKISTAIKGVNGVYVIKVNNINNVSSNGEVEKNSIAQSNRFKVEYKALDAIKNQVEITDNRARFY